MSLAEISFLHCVKRKGVNFYYSVTYCQMSLSELSFLHGKKM